MPEQRRREILDLLRERGGISVGAVEEQFGVSQVTARRDLNLLARQGRAIRAYGGAVLPEETDDNDSFDNRLQQDVSGKYRIAKVLVQGITSNESLYIDSSSAGYYIAREILDSGVAVTLLTNSLPIMSAVSKATVPTVKLVGLGGTLHKQTRSFVGSETVRSIRNFVADRLVLSVQHLETKGFLTESDPLEAHVKRAMIDHARTVVLVAAEQNRDSHCVNVVADAEAVDIAYLAAPTAEHVQMLRTAGVRIHRV